MDKPLQMEVLFVEKLPVFWSTLDSGMSGTTPEGLDPQLWISFRLMATAGFADEICN